MTLEPLPTDRPLRVLALAGGGFLGFYTAVVLQGLEERAGIPLGRCFDLMAGTSIGGVLALALAYEVPMSKMVGFFVTQGPAVFSSRALPNGAVSQLLDLSRSVLGPKYSGRALRDALRAELGTLKLADALHRVIVPAVDVQLCQTKIFKTPHAAASVGDGDLLAMEVATAACAVPAYFPSVRIRGRLYADGGLFAVAPDQIALHELEHFMGADLNHLSMLSIGTAARHYRPSASVEEDAGAVGWLSGGRLMLTILSVQQQHVQAMVEDRLGEHYLRLDADWPVNAQLGVDVVTPKSIKILQELATKTLTEVLSTDLKEFLGVTA